MPNKIEIVVSGTNKDAKTAIAAAAAETKKLGDAATAASKQTAELGGSLKKVLTSDLIQSVGQSASQLLGSVTRAASGLSSSLGGTQAVFGDLSDEVGDFAKTASESVGLSEREFREMTTLVGGQLKRMTGDVNLAADASIQLTQVAADLATTYGGTTREAMDSFAAALRGEADPAERFNLDLKITAVNAKAVEMGLADSTAAVDNNARAQALLALILEQYADAQGAFAGSAENASVAQQKATAAIENAQAQLGQVLLPALAAVADGVAVLARGFSSLSDPVQAVTGIIGTLVAAFLILAPRIIAARTALIEFGLSAKVANRSLGVIGIALGVLTTALVIFGGKTDDASGDVQEFGATLDQATGKITDNTRALALQKLEQEGAAAAAQRLGINQRDLVDAALGNEDAATRVRDRWAEVSDGMAFGSQKSRQLTNDFVLVRDSAEDVADALLQSQSAHKRAQEAGVETGQVMRDVADAHEQAAQKATDQLESLQALGDELKKQIDPVYGLIAAQGDLRDAQLAVIEAEEAHGRKSPQWRQALRDEGRAATDVLVAAGRLGDEFTGGLSRAQRRMLRDAGASSAAIHALAADMRQAKADIDRLDGSRARVQVEANVQAALAAISQVSSALALLRATGFSPLALAGFAHGGITGAQGGGPRSGPTLVNEQGPELARMPSGDVVSLPFGSTVIPAGQSAQMITGGQPARVVVEVVPRSGASSELMDVLVRELSFRVRTDAGGDVQEFFGGGGL